MGVVANDARWKPSLPTELGDAVDSLLEEQPWLASSPTAFARQCIVEGVQRALELKSTREAMESRAEQTARKSLEAVRAGADVGNVARRR